MKNLKIYGWIFAVALIGLAAYLFIEMEVNKLGYEAGVQANKGFAGSLPPWLAKIAGLS